MKTIQLTKGQVAFVDDIDYEWLNQWKWCADKIRNTWYAKRTIHVDKKQKAIYMHRQILDLLDSNIKGDHEDHNGLNNQRSNLRIASNGQNLRNRLKSKNTSSTYKGVSWDKRNNKWMCTIGINKKSIYLGRYINEKDAALAYNTAAITHFGEFANLNIII